MRRNKPWLIGLLIVLVLAACSSSEETEQPGSAEPTPEMTELTSTIAAPEEESTDSLSQEEAYDQLSEDVGFEPEFIVDMGIARFIAPYLPASSGDPEAAARSFFEAYAGLYGLEAIDQSLQLSQLQELDSGSLVRFQQYLDHLPVYAGQAVVSISSDNLIAFVNSALLPTTSISMEPGIDSQAAVQSAVESSGDAAAQIAREPQLMVFSPRVLAIDETAASLVWEVGLLVAEEGGGPAVLIQYLVDAANGDILLEVPEHLSAENWVVSSSQNSDEIVKWYEMSAGELSVEVDGSGQRLADEEGSAAQNNMDATWDYFFNTHNWDGHDNNGGKCNITVHVGTDWENATCGADCDCKFGDGVGGWGAFLDVLAHEFTHAVVGQTAGLNYLYQSGAINEHYADFFAAMVETSDWLNSNPKGFRNLSDPPNGSYESPDHYDEMIRVDIPARGNDYGWVHFNSGIPNKAAFMVADTGLNTHPDSGIEVQGLGRSISEQIWFNTLLGLGSSTSLVQWASSTVGTAYSFVPDAISEEQACEVQYAMQAVGLREPDCRCNDEAECPLSGGRSQIDAEEGATLSPDEPLVGNACDHPYLPVRPGSRWSYVDGEGNSSEYTVREVTGDENAATAIVDSMIVGSEMSLSMTHTWSCDEDGIRAPITSIGGFPGGVEAVVFGEEEGILLPSPENLRLGEQWNYNTLFVMDISSPEIGSMEVSNDRRETYTAETMRSVSVPVGDFEALEISGSYTVTTEIAGFSNVFTGTETLWFAEGVGLIKDSQDGEYFIELVDYFIPER
jgi:Zn-dependent metalloprotease